MGTGPARQGRENSSRVHHIRNRDGEPVRGRLGNGKKKKEETAKTETGVVQVACPLC